MPTTMPSTIRPGISVSGFAGRGRVRHLGLVQRQFKIVLFFLKPGLLGLKVQQPLPVGDRNLIVIRVDFAERQEAMPVAAILDEGRLQTRFHPHDLGEVYIAFELAFRRRLDIKVFEAIPVQNHDAGFFRVRGIDQHTLGHQEQNSGAPAVATPAPRFPDQTTGPWAAGFRAICDWRG